MAGDVDCVGEGVRARGTAVKTALERRGWSVASSVAVATLTLDATKTPNGPLLPQHHRRVAHLGLAMGNLEPEWNFNPATLALAKTPGYFALRVCAVDLKNAPQTAEALDKTSKPTEGEVPPAGCAGVVCANETNKKKTKWRAFSLLRIAGERRGRGSSHKI